MLQLHLTPEGWVHAKGKNIEGVVILHTSAHPGQPPECTERTHYMY
jgi:hypothetical protein